MIKPMVLVALVMSVATSASAANERNTVYTFDTSGTFDAELQSPVAGLLLVGETLGVLAVPEPSSWALMLTGLAVVGRLARRRLSTLGMSDRPSSPALG